MKTRYSGFSTKGDISTRAAYYLFVLQGGGQRYTLKQDKKG